MTGPNEPRLYAAQEGSFVGGAPPCRRCHAAYRLHSTKWLVCPERYRPSTLAEAKAELARAEASGDAAQVFVARGEVQRLGQK